MTGRQVLLAAAELDVADDPALWAPHHIGQGLTRALRQAAGLYEGEWPAGALNAYYEAYEPLEELCARLKPTPMYRGSPEHGPVQFWAQGKTDDERRELLLTMARELP